MDDKRTNRLRTRLGMLNTNLFARYFICIVVEYNGMLPTPSHEEKEIIFGNSRSDVC